MIYLYKANLNLLLGLKWKDSIQKAQEDGTFNQGQYGCCPGRLYICDTTRGTAIGSFTADLNTLNKL